MKIFLHSLLLLLAALVVGVHVPGGEGGENASGTGVWILPFSCNVNSGSPVVVTEQPRMCFSVSDLSRDVRLQQSDEVGVSVASCADLASGNPISLPVIGRQVVVPASVMRALSVARVGAEILVVDAEGHGYHIALRVVPNSAALRFSVY